MRGWALALWLGIGVAAPAAAPGAVAAAPPTFAAADPPGDDVGPGGYTYPTHPDYRPGSFDLVSVTAVVGRRDVTFELRFRAPILDPWASARWGGHGFSLQHVQIYLDTGRGGQTDALPGVNLSFSDGAWDKVILVTAEAHSAVKRRIRRLDKGVRKRVVTPRRVEVEGDRLRVQVRRRDLVRRRAEPSTWRWQVLIGSTDVYAPPEALFSRAVEREPAPHRFGGGAAGDCDPHVVDVLLPTAAAQRRALGFEAAPCRLAVVPLLPLGGSASAP